MSLASAEPAKGESPLSDETQLPQLRSDVTLRQLGEDEFVAKSGSRRAYYQLGAEEYFLLSQLATPTNVRSLRKAFQERFGERLSRSDLAEFLDLIGSCGLVKSGNAVADDPSASDFYDDDEDEETQPTTGRKRQSLLYYRVPLTDPDRLLTWIVKRLPGIWTPMFLVVTLLGMCFAFTIVMANRAALASSFSASWRWETVLVAWAVILAATALHEIAHGATCKRFGGDVHEAGVLLLFFMPCLYCNVSDAWLIGDKKKRLLITAAGGYCDLCVWALAVFVWRVTIQDSLVNYLSFVLLTVCGSRGLINLNPAFKLDGYYLLCDWLEIPNLYRRGREHWMGYVRHWLWGAERPGPQPRGWWLFCYGFARWSAALVFLDLVFLRALKFSVDQFGFVGLAFTTGLLLYAVRRVFKGFFRSEFMTMITVRPRRAHVWVAVLAAGASLLFVIPIHNYATGNFEVRPGNRVEVPAPVPSFVGAVRVEDGATVKAGDVLVELHAPDLQSQIETKQAELRESEANLAKLKLGPRREELEEQAARVKRLQAWYDLGKVELETARKSLEHELSALDHRIQQARAELEFAQGVLQHSQRLHELGALAGSELQHEKSQLAVLESKLGEAHAAYQARATEGVRVASAEFARREQELADAEARLSLLRVGTRPEEIAAEAAHRERVMEELKFLHEQQGKLVVLAPADGLVSAPRLREKVGQFAPQGTLLCHIENAAHSQVEISIAEDDALHVQPGQSVRLKARALPFRTFEAVVERIAPAAVKPQGAVQNVVMVHCSLIDGGDELKSGMTGFGRVSRGWNTIGLVLLSKSLRYVRTEFWW